MSAPCEVQEHAHACSMEYLLMERSLNEHWSVEEDGSVGDYLGDGNVDEFSNYLCDNCGESFDDWDGAVAHLKQTA